MMWSYLIHLGVNMWSDRDEPLPGVKPRPGVTHRATDLVCEKPVWDRVTGEMAEAGFTHLVIDLGEAIQYESHPELAVKGSWTPEHLRTELDRIRSLGMTPLPKLNFSTSHDGWLGVYGRQVSTPPYYQVCGDLIAEVSALFDTPEFFHLGMDEETPEMQASREHVVVRRGNVWWHDLGFLCDRVREAGVRPWVWSDPAWSHPDEFYARMPKDVLQSNWYYGLWFEANETNRPRVLNRGEHFLTYLDLEDNGYEQVPTASSWRNAWDNLGRTVDFCTDRIPAERLRGFMQAPWVMTTTDELPVHLETIERAAQTIRSASAAT